MVEFRLRDGTGRITLKWVIEDTDRHGNVRLYVRRRPNPKVRLMETPGTPEFMAEYQAAINGVPYIKGAPAVTPAKKPAPPVRRDTRPGSFQALCEFYYASGMFQGLAPSTRAVRRRELDALCIAHGHRSARTIETIHIVKIRDDKAETPDAANNLVKTLRHMFSAAVEGGLLPSNPAAGVKKLTTGGEGHHTWTMKEVEAFELVHPLGTMPRLALALLLYTGQRRSDVIRMGPQHIRDGHIVITQAKNARRNPVTVQIPIISALQEALDAMPGGHLAFLTTAYGRPFSPAGFGIRFREWCNKAGLIHCSAHGLRKAALTRLAELGASELEMAAISGHRDLNQLRPYTRAARQRVLAGHAMALFEEHLSNKNVPPKSEVRRSGTFSVRKALKSLTR